MKAGAIFLVALGCLLVSISEVSGKARWYQRYIKFFNETLPNSPTLMRLWEKHIKKHNELTKRADTRYPVPPFNCHVDYPWGNREPTSVHNLHPHDIDVIGAMGDSLTAGNGVDADNVFEDLIQFRGLSWSGGGDESLDAGVLTLPNVLRKYRSDLQGYATGLGAATNSNARLNVAEAGDTSFEMPGQADMLISRLQAMPGFQTDWKVITLFIGGNDLCDACNDWNHYSPANYGNNLRIALDKLHAAVPRAFVNLVPIFDIAPVAQLGHNDFMCTLVHAMVCACGQATSNTAALAQLTLGYQQQAEQLVASGRYDTRDDFTVVIQPFFKKTVPPDHPLNANDVDMSYFSADCFHFSGKGQGAAALSLWNNMCEAVGSKQEDWHLNQPFHCPGSTAPGEHLYFQTTKNKGM